MRKMLFAVALLLLTAMSAADFVLESVRVTISDIQPDGSATVNETVKFLVRGNFSNQVYDSGLKMSEDLSRWSTNIGLSDIRQHVNPAKVVISNFRLQPQPRVGCNPFLGTCHGSLIMYYSVKPVYNDSVPVNGTGLFSIVDYKPRTTRYMLNPDALSFTSTEGGNVLLGSDTYLTVDMPQGSVLVDMNPSPSSTKDAAEGKSLTWNDMVLVRFSLVFDVEESIDKEVGKFFSGALTNFQSTMKSQHGMAFLAILAILIGSYIYITVSKKRKEE